MRVILLKNVNKIGQAGDVKEVADGFARNFLLPNGLAEAASSGNIEKVKEERARRERLAIKDLTATEKVAQQLAGVVLEMRGRVNESGKLYAAITPATIVKKLKDRNIIVTKDQIILKENIKEIGEYPVRISLPHGLEAEITILAAEQS